MVAGPRVALPRTPSLSASVISMTASTASPVSLGGCTSVTFGARLRTAFRQPASASKMAIFTQRFSTSYSYSDSGAAGGGGIEGPAGHLVGLQVRHEVTPGMTGDRPPAGDVDTQILE